MKKQIIATLCAVSIVFTTPVFVNANPPKFFSNAKSQNSNLNENMTNNHENEVISTNSEQNNQDLEKNQIENLTDDLIKSYDVENIGEDLKISSEIIKKLSEMEDFHEQEANVAKAIAVAAKKRFFDEIDANYDIKIKNILKKCLNNSCARKYVACAIGRLITRKFFNNVYNQNGEEIKDMLMQCSKSFDAKFNVASATRDWIEAKIGNNYALNNTINTINLLSNCSDSNEALKKISSAIYCLLNKNNSVSQKNLYDIFKLLSICIKNDNYSALHVIKAISILLTKNNFLELAQKKNEIKKDIINLMRKCWSVHTDRANTHCVIEEIFSENPQNLFSEEDMETVKSAKLKKWDFDVKKCCEYSNMEADDILIDEKNVFKNIIDKNSENEKDKTRNEIRKFINSEFLKHISFICPAMPSICVQYQTNYGWRREQVISKIKNKFDHFLYAKILDWINENFKYTQKSSSNQNKQSKEFDFLETKTTLFDELIKEEKDLIKQLLLKIMYKNVQNFFNPQMTLNFDDPYDYKVQIEKIYFDWIKKYHASCNIKYDMDGCLIKQKAHLAALEDAKNKKMKLNLNENNENFMTTYIKTYAMATAELDAKQSLGRNNEFSNNANIQNIYDVQYEKVIQHIGAYDGEKIKSRRIYDKDSKSQKIYDEAYLNSIEKIAKYDLISESDNYYDRLKMFEWNEAKKAYEKAFAKELYANLQENVKEDIEQVEINIPEKIDIAQDNVEIYMDIYENNMFRLGFDEFCGSDLPKFEINETRWKNLFEPNNYETQELTKFKARLKKAYIEGCKSGCKMRGYFRGLYNDKTYNFSNSRNVILKKFYYQGYFEGIEDRKK